MEPHALSPAERNWYLLCWDLEREDWRTFRVDRLDAVQHTRVLFEPRPLTAEQTEEFFRVAAAWVRQPVETDLVMDLPYDAMREYFGQWGQGATPETDATTRWPVGGADFRETMYGMSWIPEGVGYTTDLAEPARSELRESLVRMLAALDAPPPPPRSSHRRLIGKPQETSSPRRWRWDNVEAIAAIRAVPGSGSYPGALRVRLPPSRPLGKGRDPLGTLGSRLSAF